MSSGGGDIPDATTFPSVGANGAGNPEENSLVSPDQITRESWLMLFFY